jgi:hypothetical protein
MARKNDGACGNPKLIRTDVDCRAARPKFNEGAWSPAKISDVTGGGLYLFATPDESWPRNAASKLWWIPRGSRSHRSSTYSQPCRRCGAAGARRRTIRGARLHVRDAVENHPQEPLSAASPTSHGSLNVARNSSTCRKQSLSALHDGRRAAIDAESRAGHEVG